MYLAANFSLQVSLKIVIVFIAFTYTDVPTRVILKSEKKFKGETGKREKLTMVL